MKVWGTKKTITNTLQEEVKVAKNKTILNKMKLKIFLSDKISRKFIIKSVFYIT